MARKKAIRKVTVEVFCFARDVRQVKESLGEWFDDNEAALFGQPPKVTKPTRQEESEVRPQLEEMCSLS
jgi:hypothetical protein